MGPKVRHLESKHQYMLNSLMENGALFHVCVH